MKKLIPIIFMFLFTLSAEAKQCIVNTSTGEIKEWTSGVYCEKPKLSANEELKEFKTIPSDFNKKLTFENGDIKVTNIDLPKEETLESRLKKMETDINSLKVK